MPKINLLPKEIAELIAAGEVVERPASVVKELVENSIDSGATGITVEIQNGGILYIRITDNGCGISPVDVKTAFMRHATSKISREDDLYSIGTLGFRGEALAAISSVSKIEMFTKPHDEEFGTRYHIEGGTEVDFETAGCPDGTTIVIKDLFFNTPARMKFLKKDISEGNAVAAVIDRLALSHPEISFKFIRDGKQLLNTPGDDNLESAVYCVLGREFSKGLINVDYSLNGVSVKGLTAKPLFCKATRNSQYLFLNGRFVKSFTAMAAAEQAYKNSAMTGKFPGFVLNISIPLCEVDVNVHPAKTEVRFSDEKRIFDCVFYAVKNAVFGGDTRPVINIKNDTEKLGNFESDKKRFSQQPITVQSPQTITESIISGKFDNFKVKPENELNDSPVNLIADSQIVLPEPIPVKKINIDIVKDPQEESVEEQYLKKARLDCIKSPAPEIKKISENLKTADTQETPLIENINIIGEAFGTYIIAQSNQSLYMIDKHAAHERIIFNSLKENGVVDIQDLLVPVTVKLEKTEYNAIVNNLELLLKAGFEVEDFGNGTVIVRSIAASLFKEDVNLLISEIAEGLMQKGIVEIERLDNLYHTVACKAAIKAGFLTGKAEMTALAAKVLNDRQVMYCPHGRPVAYEIRKYDIEKQFGRIQ